MSRMERHRTQQSRERVMRSLLSIRDPKHEFQSRSSKVSDVEDVEKGPTLPRINIDLSNEVSSIRIGSSFAIFSDDASFLPSGTYKSDKTCTTLIDQNTVSMHSHNQVSMNTAAGLHSIHVPSQINFQARIQNLQVELMEDPSIDC